MQLVHFLSLFFGVRKSSSTMTSPIPYRNLAIAHLCFRYTLDSTSQSLPADRAWGSNGLGPIWGTFRDVGRWQFLESFVIVTCTIVLATIELSAVDIILCEWDKTT